MKTEANAPIGLMNAWLLKKVAVTDAERDTLLVTSAEAVNSEAQINAPIKTGDLKDSHFVGAVEDGQISVGASIAYAAAVHAKHPTKANWYADAIRNNYRRVVGVQLRALLRAKGAR